MATSKARSKFRHLRPAPRNPDDLVRVVKAQVLGLGRSVALLFALLFSIRARSAVAVLAVLVVG
jgi:hypothetical protein